MRRAGEGRCSAKGCPTWGLRSDDTYTQACWLHRYFVPVLQVSNIPNILITCMCLMLDNLKFARLCSPKCENSVNPRAQWHRGAEEQCLFEWLQNTFTHSAEIRAESDYFPFTEEKEGSQEWEALLQMRAKAWAHCASWIYAFWGLNLDWNQGHTPTSIASFLPSPIIRAKKIKLWLHMEGTQHSSTIIWSCIFSMVTFNPAPKSWIPPTQGHTKVW